MDHAKITPTRVRRMLLGASILLASACSGPKDAPTAPERGPEVVALDVSSMNVASAANGATVVASSVHSAAFPVSGTINGDRLGINWGNGGGWNDGTFNQWPDWLEVTFAGSQTIGEVDVFTIQDNYLAPVTPTLGLTTQAGLTDFRIETWNGAAWVVVPNGTITGSNKVWWQVTFPPVTTTKVRLWITGARDNWSRVAELEAWTVAAGPAPSAFAKTSPSNGATPSPNGVTLSWAASTGATTYEYCVDATNNNSCDGSWVSTANLTATLGALTAGTPYVWQVRARNATGTTEATGGTWWSFTPTSGGGAQVNVAAAANGATVVASSVYSAAFPVGGTINGDRLGTNWGNGGGWNDGTFNQWPDWLEVTFAGSQTIGEVDVFTIQDNYLAPVTPTLGLTTQAGLTDFRIETWNGAAWVVVPNGTITGSNKVWWQVTFPPVTTTKVRLWITGARDNWSRVAELEAWTVAAGPAPSAFAKTSPSNGATPSPNGVTLSWAASTGATTYEYCVDATNNNSCDGSWVSTANLTATLGALTAGTPYVWQVRARNATGTTEATGGTWWSFTPTSGGGAQVNVAAASNGATVVASSVYSAAFPASGAINGDRLGINWGNGGGWNDGTFNQWPDWLEVTFAGSQTIGEVDVFTIQDNYLAPVTPTLGLTTQAGLTDFRIESWNGTAWVVVPNGTITGSTQVWRQVTFPALTTTKIRLWITSARDSWSRVAELEAWTVGPAAVPGAFAKTSPSNGAAQSPSDVTLGWAGSSGAATYEYCVDATNNNSCDGSWVSTANLTATLGALTAGTSYVWQVRARNATGTTEANGGMWWSFTTSGFGLSVEKVYLTQATQRPNGTVSLVADRNALLRVFVTANASNTARPDVRVRIYDGVSLLQTVTIPAPEASVRSTSSEGVLTSTWNTIVPAANVRPALRVVAEVDPAATVPDADRLDNVWPRGGSPAPVSVTTVPTFTVRFVPITVAGVTGTVSESNKEQFLTSTRLFMPIKTIVADVRAPFTTSAPALQFDNGNSAWNTVLSELNALRVTDGAPTTQHYYGVVKTPYGSGVAGIGYVPGRAALGWDNLPSGDAVAVHEWGHNFSRLHTPCAVSGDNAYPYSGGIIGMWGWNSTTNTLVSPNAADFMGYCSNPWISDWTWSNVMAYRQAAGFQTVALQAAVRGPVEGLLVWGRVVDGRVILEPSFRVRTSVTPLPALASHHVQLLDATGATLLDVPLNADVVDHATAQSERQFAVVVPWSASLERSLARVRVSDVRQPLASAERATVGLVRPDPTVVGGGAVTTLPEPQSEVTAVDASHARVRWNSVAYPMAMVRDASTGAVMGFLRRPGQAVTTNGRRIDVVFSDGVRSAVRR